MIHRSDMNLEGRAAPMDSRFLRDKNLSYADKGLLAYLLSFPDGTDVTSELLSQCSTNKRDPLIVS